MPSALAILSVLSSAFVVAADEGGAPTFLLLLGPVAGGLVYLGFWSFYRNTGKSHAFDRETRVDAKPVTGSDAKVREVKGTKKTGIDGANHREHRSRVQRM